jgi:hypothetical protein
MEWGRGGEMTQTLYAHMNKKNKNKKINKAKCYPVNLFNTINILSLI